MLPVHSLRGAVIVALGFFGSILEALLLVWYVYVAGQSVNLNLAWATTVMVVLAEFVSDSSHCDIRL